MSNPNGAAIEIVENIPSGLPSPVLPDISVWPEIFSAAITIAIISFSINISLATVFSRKHKYKVDSTQVSFRYLVTFT